MSILQKIYSFFIDTIQTILLAASFFLVIYVFFFRPFQVSGQSMFPTFHDKEYVLTNLIVMQFEEAKRGDVVVFKSPTDEEKDFIKRVIGVAGDTVSIVGGKVFVNDTQLDETQYLSSDVYTSTGSFMKEGQKVTVPNTRYFVIGDNRSHSSDSREWGFVKKTAIIGKSLFVYWPLPRARLVKNPFPD